MCTNSAVKKKLFFCLLPEANWNKKLFDQFFFYASPSGPHHLHLPWWKKKKREFNRWFASLLFHCAQHQEVTTKMHFWTFHHVEGARHNQGWFVGAVCVFVWQDVILGWAQMVIAPKTVTLFITKSRFTTLHRSKTFCWNPPSFKRWKKSIFLLTFWMLSHIVSLRHDLSLTPYSARHLYKYHLSSVLTVTDQKPGTTSWLCGLGGRWERRDQPRLLRWHRLGEAES